MKLVVHPLKPVYERSSRVLILGTMPSPKSREAGFYYSHPQNRFWRVLSLLLNQALPSAAEEKKRFLLRNKIAIWDVLQSCEIIGAGDSSIKKPIANDLRPLLAESEIKAVFTTGAAAFKLYKRLCLPQTGLPAIALPSTSAANAACSLQNLTENKLSDYAVIVHGIKSVSASIAAEDISKRALKLETMAKAGDYPGVLAENDLFVIDTQTLVDNVKKWLLAQK